MSNFNLACVILYNLCTPVYVMIPAFLAGVTKCNKRNF